MWRNSHWSVQFLADIASYARQDKKGNSSASAMEVCNSQTEPPHYAHNMPPNAGVWWTEFAPLPHPPQLKNSQSNDL